MQQKHNSDMKLKYQRPAKLYAKAHVIRRAFAPIAAVQVLWLIMLLGVAEILMKMEAAATVQYLNQYKPNVTDVRQQVTYGQSMAYNGSGLCRWESRLVSPTHKPKMISDKMMSL